jgi:hypothetical protein
MNVSRTEKAERYMIRGGKREAFVQKAKKESLVSRSR